MSTRKTYTRKEMLHHIGERETQKIRTKHKKRPSVWDGFSLFGTVGWSVAIPTLVGAIVGFLLDEYYPSKQSWSLIFLIAGLVLGSFLAWHWVSDEDKKMHDKTEENHD